MSSEAIRTCSKCGETKPLTAFSKASGGGREYWCLICSNLRKQLRKYRMPEEQYREWLALCGGLCECCGKPFTKTPHIDHDRRCCIGGTGSNTRTCGECNRGLVCDSCNYMIGWIEKTGPLILEQATAYLLKKGA